MQGSTLNMACKKSQKSINPCAFFKNRAMASEQLPWSPLDIEELHQISQQKLFCPYYSNKDRVTGADIIFMPYNYLIDPKIRENYSINYKDSVIIFDEAHNASSVAEDVSSFEIVGKMLEQCLDEMRKLQAERRVKENGDANFTSSEEDTDSLIQMTESFHRYLEYFELDQRNIQNFAVDSQYLKNCVVMPGFEIINFFKEGTSCKELSP